jgi:hypothetical protein
MTDSTQEDHAIVYSIDGGETWELQGTFGKPMSARSRQQLRQALRRRYTRVSMHSVPYSKLPEYGLE